MKRLLLLFGIVGCCVACTTSKVTVSSSANLSRYNYATMTDVMGYGGSAVLMDMEVKVYDALSVTRLQVIGDGQIERLSDTQKQQLLLVRFSASQSDEESVVSINFVDYVTGRPVASCRGAFGFGWTKGHDMNVAVNKAIEQMEKLF